MQQQSGQQSQLAQQLQPTTSAADVPEMAAAEETTAGAWQVDPNEPRYCVCNDVSYGDMVGCDNEDVRRVQHPLLLHHLLTPVFVSGLKSNQFG